MYMRWLLILSLLFPLGLMGQEFDRTFTQKVGIVRIYCNNPKVKLLENLASDPKSTPDQRKQADEELKSHQIDRVNYTRSLIDNFNAYYNITPVYFMPDSLYRAFLTRPAGAYFLDSRGQIDPNISLPEDSEHYLIVQENYDYDFRILDANGNPPPYPFPYKLKYGFFSKIRAFMGEHGSMSVKRLQKQLSFYLKS